MSGIQVGTRVLVKHHILYPAGEIAPDAPDYWEWVYEVEVDGRTHTIEISELHGVNGLRYEAMFVFPDGTAEYVQTTADMKTRPFLSVEEALAAAMQDIYENWE